MSQSVIEKFSQLNNDLSAVVSKKVLAVYGTPEERTLLRNITKNAIDCGNEFRKDLVKGITYEVWVGHLIHSVNNPSVRDMVADDIAPLEALRTFIENNDLKPMYDYYQNSGFFDLAKHDEAMESLELRYASAEVDWAKDDEGLTSNVDSPNEPQ